MVILGGPMVKTFILSAEDRGFKQTEVNRTDTLIFCRQAIKVVDHRDKHWWLV